MKDFYLVKYSVRGIKTLDQLVSLSFYKKTISRDMNTQEYNIKGVYGINGSGKTGIIASVDILKNLLLDPGYLNNPMVQKNLEALINKKTGELFIEVEFISDPDKGLFLFHYEILLSKNEAGKYVINHEWFSLKKASSKSAFLQDVFKVENGEIISIDDSGNNELSSLIKKKMVNLLTTATVCALFNENIMPLIKENYTSYISPLFFFMFALSVFEMKLHVYLDQTDDHKNYFLRGSLGYTAELEKTDQDFNSLMKSYVDMENTWINFISVTENYMPKWYYGVFARTVEGLRDFLRIFKPELQDIEIVKKEDKEVFICSLLLVYDSYKINAEFESTGIKKLIRLYAYLREMVHGGIVFIDEFDSNLHDVYLCALLEYLMEYGEGQLCFTTHNVGPMDVLRRRRKSIDFLSVDHKIYSWKTNGNYSPAKLYRNGMIEGSPFNVESIDFIGVFDSGKEGA